MVNKIKYFSIFCVFHFYHTEDKQTVIVKIFVFYSKVTILKGNMDKYYW